MLLHIIKKQKMFRVPKSALAFHISLKLEAARLLFSGNTSRLHHKVNPGFQ